MNTDGIYAGCASARGQCDGCFPESACGLKRPESVTVFKSGLHMHQTGAKIATTQRRRGADKVVNQINWYKFNFQDATRVNYTMQPGDTYNTTCWYDNKGADT